MEMFIPGVTVNCERLATAEPAGFIPSEPMSPPRAVKAFPIAIVLAVPSYSFSLKRSPSSQFWAVAENPMARIAAVNTIFFIYVWCLIL